jgi:urea transport system permease protein
LLQALFDGTSLGSILLLVALGLAFTFGLMNVINMAHGEFIMIGAYVTYVFQVTLAPLMGSTGEGAGFLLSIPAAFVVTALLGIVLETTFIRFLYGRPLDSLLATWGIGLILQQAARSIFGAPNVQVSSPAWLNGGLSLFDVQMSYKRLFIIALAVVSVAGVYALMYRTTHGRRVRAVMQGRETAACLGVSTRRVDALTFGLGAGLAGVAGCALTLLGSIGSSLGTYYIVDAFMVVVLGGVGRLPGTILAAFTIGVLNTVLELGTTATVAKVLILVAIIAFLQWKPAGLVALRTR